MRKWLVGVAFVVALVAAWAVRLYWLAGEFKRLEPHFAGECTTVTGAVGAEDIVIHRAAGIAFVSATDRRAAMAGRAPRGAIYLYDLADARHGLRNLTLDASPEPTRPRSARMGRTRTPSTIRARALTMAVSHSG